MLFKELTQEGEKLGLYEKSRTIGFRKNWEQLISNKGYYLDEQGRIKPKSESTETPPLNSNQEIERHKTAIDRNQLSQPMQILARHDYLNGEWSLLDYGCGKGDDLRELEAHGLNISGWDPVHAPKGLLIRSDIVNLGFVLNVIEDRNERTETLKKAWKYASKILIVSVMVAGESTISRFQGYRDGVITSRNTFQKYYSQSEIKNYIEQTLSEDAIAVGQGIFMVFSDQYDQQQFLSERQHIRRNWQQKTQRALKARGSSIRKDKIDKHIDLFTDFWETCLELGRIPANSEFEFSEQIRRIAGSHNKAYQALINHFGSDLFEESKQARKEDLLVYFALGLFERRKPQTKMPDSLKRDIKAFFTSYTDAIEQATKLLFSVGSPTTIYEACLAAHEKLRCGHMEENHSYTFHIQYLGELPPELRVYIGCATQMYGDIEDMHLIKAHIRSGKVSLMRYDDWDKETPLLVERVKIKLRDQDIDFFDYGGEFESPPLEIKDKF
jgi:DNA phosphorothioation-associated putative methyltransferase